MNGNGGNPGTGKKSVEAVAKEVLTGKWGNGEDRKKRLQVAGYDYPAVQAKVNELVKGSGKRVWKLWQRKLLPESGEMVRIGRRNCRLRDMIMEQCREK